MESYLIKNKKPLYVDGSTVIASYGYELFISNNDGRTWKFFANIDDNKYSLFSKIRLFSRLLRVEVTELFMAGNEYYCLAKKGIYRHNEESGCFKKIFHIDRGSRPINVAVDHADNVYFGEYFSNNERDSVKVYGMSAGTNKFKCLYVFPENTIRHVHGIYYDEYGHKLWFVTGDNDDECIIGYTDDKFKTINKVLFGKQQYRAVKLFFYKKFIIYGTDTPNEENFIYKIDRNTWAVQKLISVEGSVIYGTQIGSQCFLSTTVEPSNVNLSKRSVLYYSGDGLTWYMINAAHKDIYPMTYFQFGSMIFPKYKSCSDYLFYYGRALKEIDGNSIRIKIDDVKKKIYE